jgi:hypothetical protein
MDHTIIAAIIGVIGAIAAAAIGSIATKRATTRPSRIESEKSAN